MDGKTEHYNAIWNVYLELQKQVNNKKERVFLHYLKWFGTTDKVYKYKDAKWCIMAVFETIWNSREKIENKDA